MLPDDEALARFGIELESERGALLREGGFVVVDRYDGHTPPGAESGYADFLRARGYASADPWSDFVIAAEDGGARRFRLADAQRAPCRRACARSIPRPRT